MTPRFRALSSGLVAAAALAATCQAGAQGTTAAAPGALHARSGSSRPGRGFIDLNVGRATYHTDCGVAGLTCQDNVTSYSVTAGHLFSDDFGAELTYLNFGTARRAGGGVSARGLNLSAVGKLPLGQYFALEGKVGATYGITHVNALAGSGVSSGKAKGFGLGYGAALDLNIGRHLQGQVGWEQHDFHFAGQGMSKVRNVTVGLNYRF